MIYFFLIFSEKHLFVSCFLEQFFLLVCSRDPLVGLWGALPSMLTVARATARKRGWQIVQLHDNAIAKWAAANLKKTRPARSLTSPLTPPSLGYTTHTLLNNRNIWYFECISMPGRAESIQDILDPDPCALTLVGARLVDPVLYPGGGIQASAHTAGSRVHLT